MRATAAHSPCAELPNSTDALYTFASNESISADEVVSHIEHVICDQQQLLEIAKVSYRDSTSANAANMPYVSDTVAGCIIGKLVAVSVRDERHDPMFAGFTKLSACRDAAPIQWRSVGQRLPAG